MREIELIQVGQMVGMYESAGRVYAPDGLCPTITTMGGGNLQPKIYEKSIVCADRNRSGKVPQGRVGRYSANLNVERSLRGGGLEVKMQEVIGEPIALDEQNKCLRMDGTVGTLTTDGSSPKHNNRVIEPFVRGSLQEHASERSDDICPTLTEAMGMGGGQVPVHNYGYRIRKLTPRETWRLMAFSDEDFDKAREVNSDAQLYKQAGNSICVNVLEEIFKKII